MLVCLFLLLVTKEEYGVSIVGFGFLWGFLHKDWKRGVSVMLAGMIASVLILGLFMPYFHGGAHPMLASEANHLSRYGWLSAPWPEKLRIFYTLMFGDGTPQVTGIVYFSLLLLCGFILPLLAPLFMAPALGDLLANLLSTNPMPRHRASYHSAAIIPVVIVAGLRGYVWLKAKRPDMRVAMIAAIAAMGGFLAFSGFAFYPFAIWELSAPAPAFERAPIARILQLIGDAPISVQANIGMFFSHRRNIYPFPHQLEKVHYVVLQLYQPFSDPDQSHFGIPFGEDTGNYVETLLHFMSDKEWHIAYWQAPLLVMQRGASTQDETAERKAIEQAILALGSITRPAPQNP